MNKIILVIIFICFSLTNLWGQIRITGIVLSKNDKLPLPGVNIQEIGNDNGTITSIKGEFTLVVKNENSIIKFSFVGFETQELTLNEKKYFEVFLKPQCHRDWFDAQNIFIHFSSGLINTPVGGEFDLSLPPLWRHVTLWSGIGIQSNLKDINHIYGDFGLYHLFVSCNFDADIFTTVRKISFKENLNARTLAFESNLNFRSYGLILGLSNLTFNEQYEITNESKLGPVLGLIKWVKKPLYIMIKGKASIYNGIIEYNGEIRKDFKRIKTFARFYKLKSFSEINVGLGYEFTYRL